MSEYDFEIKKTKRDFIIIRKGTENHSHMKTLQGCEKLLQFILEGTKPFNRYFDTACKRILTDEEYRQLRQPSKQRYINRCSHV